MFCFLYLFVGVTLRIPRRLGPRRQEAASRRVGPKRVGPKGRSVAWADPPANGTPSGSLPATVHLLLHRETFLQFVHRRKEKK